MSLATFTDNWATNLTIFRLPAGVPIEITWSPGSPPEAWVMLWMNQMNSADAITKEVTITNNVTNSGSYLWTPPVQYASTNDTYDYQLGVAGYEDDPGLSKGSRLFYIVPADSSSSSSSAIPTPTPSLSASQGASPSASSSASTSGPPSASSTTTPSIATTSSLSSSSSTLSPIAAPTQSPASTIPSPGSSPAQSTIAPVVTQSVSTGAAATRCVGVAIVALIIPLIRFF
ncbi:hypothetical protein NA56DRAFT_649790 [Hyaloscypha hepaticicola]|uniref:Yeast cell wall synthesis Kre9/Knh1-like N-terminal domain-containing protein n=1 Tax=Hyaloscypha hepaticicola TaxID=2082293 RepID=A0A2J6PPJ7_9HELO|nr:hypothetical protein NA56DRAFT_649790 [Hyaloscypha hepaticicola]